MSRTHRKNSFSGCVLRNPKTQNERKYSLLAVDELLDCGYNPSNRLKNTVNRKPTSFDDIVVSSYREARYSK